jgi:hypothetical protein
VTAKDKSSGIPKSLIDGVERNVCDALGIVSTRHVSTALHLKVDVGLDLAEVIFRTVDDNYKRGGAADNRNRSRENWRWHRPQPQIAPQNTSAEVVLERAIAVACASSGRADWANQVPVASGLIPGAADGRRAIDLVHQCGERHFELIELKIASDTPLYAAVEVIGYGCIWLLARAHPPAVTTSILEADHIDLRVLAPPAYYARYDLTQLEAVLDSGCRTLGLTHGVRMSFAFLTLNECLVGPVTIDDDVLLRALDNSVSRREGGRQ